MGAGGGAVKNPGPLGVEGAELTGVVGGEGLLMVVKLSDRNDEERA